MIIKIIFVSDNIDYENIFITTMQFVSYLNKKNMLQLTNKNTLSIILISM